MARSLETVHAKAKSYDWPFTVGDQRPKFPTRYTIPPTGKDPFRMLIRDYVKMEAEKDDRTHGFLDGVLRMGTAEEVQASQGVRQHGRLDRTRRGDAAFGEDSHHGPGDAEARER